MPDDKQQAFSTLKPSDIADPTLFKLNNLLDFLAQQIARNQTVTSVVQKTVQAIQTGGGGVSGQLAGGGGSGSGSGGTGGGTTPPPPPTVVGWTTLAQIQYPTLALATGMSQPTPGVWVLQGGVSVATLAADSSVAISQELWMIFQGLGYAVSAQAWYDGAGHPSPSADFIAQWPQEAYQLTLRGILAGYVPADLVTAVFQQNQAAPTIGGSSGSVSLVVSVTPVTTTIQYLDWAFAHQSATVVTDVLIKTYVLNWSNGAIQ